MPYVFGLQAAANAFISATFAVQFMVAVCILVIILVISSQHREKDDASVHLPGNPLLAIYPFFRRRYDFLTWGFQVTGQSVFQFKLLRNTVIVVSGESGRKSFFATRGFDLTEGFNVLSGAIPMIKGVTSNLQGRHISLIHKRLAGVQRNAPLSALIPSILEDCRRVMEDWGTSGILDPFERVYELLFQTTVRSLSCSEIADDAVLVARLKGLYDVLDTGTTPATVLLPWFPTVAMIKKLLATKKIYDIVVRAIAAREQSGVPRNDTLQMLLDMKDEKFVVVGFIMGLLIAGARATGTTASWIITFLGGYSDWRTKATAEVEALVFAYLPRLPSDASSLSSNLAAIPLEAWESETPVLDAIIRETLRIAQPHTAMRRNIGPDVYIDEKIVPTGAYIVYPFSDVHLNPELYPDPWKFDPSRPEPKTAFGYVGWGGGKTVCQGTRLAQLQLKLITAMFLMGFKHETVDKSGKHVDSLPKPNWNDILLCRPPKGSGNVKYERSDIPL